MKARPAFSSALAASINDYLALKRSPGRGYAAEEYVLQYLDDFLIETGSDLTSESFTRWCLAQQHLSSGGRRNRMRVVRNLCLYRRRREPACFLPDRLQFPPLHQPVEPHIFTGAEILRLLRVAGELTPTHLSPLRPQNYRLGIVLLYTTGLRRGELVRLTVGDYDPREQTLLVRDSKFHKSRLLPLSVDGCREIEAYLSARRACELPLLTETPLLWNRYQGGKGYTGVGFAQTIRVLFRAAEIRTIAGRLPRVHDIRHHAESPIMPTLAKYLLLGRPGVGLDGLPVA